MLHSLLERLGVAAYPRLAQPGAAGSVTVTNPATGEPLAGVRLDSLIQDLLDFASFVPTNNFYTTTAGVTFDLAEPPSERPYFGPR